MLSAGVLPGCRSGADLEIAIAQTETRGQNFVDATALLIHMTIHLSVSAKLLCF